MKGALLHLGGGFLVAIIMSPSSAWWLPFTSVPIMTGWGYLREWVQCRERRKPFTRHHHIEALAWGAGALVGSVVSLAWTL